MHRPTNTLSVRAVLRAALLRSAAVGALALATTSAVQAGPDACVGVGGPNIICTGNQSDGIALGPPGEVFNVNTLTTDIAPNTNIPGIFIFRIGGPITFNSDTGPFIINASGGAGFGISVRNFGAGLTNINQSGTIITEGVGLDSQSLDAASVIYVNTVGNIIANNNAIDVLAGNDVWFNSTGDLSSAASFGIQARSLFNAVFINSTSTIEAAGAGISANAQLDITIISTGDIVGGNGIQATSNGGRVTIWSDGSIGATATGIVVTSQLDASLSVFGNVQADMSGIEALSLGGNVYVSVGPTGVVTGGVNGTAGVLMSGAGDNVLWNLGSISSQNGMAIVAGIGDDEIRNTGILTGNIELDIGTNALNNLEPGRLLSGSFINVGAGNTVSNLGILSPGNTGTVQTTAITGNLTQGASGSLALDINSATGESDRINVSGTSTLAGSVVPSLLDPALLHKQFLIISTAGTLSFADLTVTDDSTTYNFTLTAIGNDLFLNIELASIAARIDAPLSPNQTATVRYLDRLLASSPSPALAAFLHDISDLPSEAAITAALDRLNPEHYLAAVGATIQSSQLFFDSLMSCPSAGGPGIVNRDGQCYWAQIRGRTTDWDRTRSNIGGSEESGSIEGGVQAMLAPDWLLGGAIAYEHSTTSTDNPASSEGDRAQAGLVTKALFGDTTIAAAVFGGYGWFDASRQIGLPQPSVTAESEQQIGFGGGGFRLSQMLDQGGWYVKPMADAALTYVSYGDVRETGAGVANLIVGGERETVLSLAAALEVGSVLAINADRTARPYLRVGITKATGSDFSLTSSFEGSPVDVAPFTVTSHLDDVLATIGAGIDVFDASGLSLNLSYEGRFGDHTETHAGAAKLRIAF